jgi:hypothetical protein
MLITKTSQITNLEHTMDIPITQEQYEEIENRFQTKKHIQHIVPDLRPELREFLISGITPLEWEQHFSPPN